MGDKKTILISVIAVGGKILSCGEDLGLKFTIASKKVEILIKEFAIFFGYVDISLSIINEVGSVFRVDLTLIDFIPTQDFFCII